MSFIIEIRQGNDVSEYSLNEPVTSIGRGPDNTIVLKDETVSTRHARLSRSDNSISITDLGSSNGTQVNGREIDPKSAVALNPGDTVAIGSFTLTLTTTSAKAPTGETEKKTEVGKSPAAKGEEPPSTGRPAAASAFTFANIPRLIVSTPEGKKEYPLGQQRITLGRDSHNDIVIDSPLASRRHAELVLKEDGYHIVDLGSTNGLLFNSQKVEDKLLGSGDSVWISDTISLTFKLTVPAEAPPSAAPEKLAVKGHTTLTIGRHPGCDIVLDHPIVSRQHARLVWSEQEKTHYLEDLGSTNGTFVNNQSVSGRVKLNSGDIIRVGPLKLTYTPEAIEKVDQSRNVRVDVLKLNQVVAKNVNLLKDISLTINPSEFVAIVGGSGAGKSTLLKALTGFVPASDGAILINGDNLYGNFEAHRSQFGYVPQEDIIHKELSVYEALDYSARLRLPADTTPADRAKRITEVMETLDLTERKNLPIHKLSGGQLKRVSIGVELLTRPALFCLDEATSGLDPGIESQMMRLLRKLSDQGHTVLLVTHATKNVLLCDQVIFMARGGYLAFYGPPDEALEYFGVKDFDLIYEKLERELSPKEWAEKYLQSEPYQKYIVQRLPKAEAVPLQAVRTAAAPGSRIKHVSSLRQFAILSHRNLNILFRDKIALVLMLALAPIVGVLHFLLWKQGMLDPSGGAPTEVIINLYMIAMIGSLVGALSVMREIVKELDVYRRERMVVLKMAPYLGSKLWVGILLAVYQTAVFLIFIRVAGGWPTITEIAPVFFTVFLAVFSSMLLGLLASALSPNQNVTPLILIVFLVPQLIFAGIIPMSQFGPVGKIISQPMTTKWAFEALVTISGLGKDVATDPCWQLPEEEREALTDEEKEKLCNCMGANMFTKCNFPSIRDYYNETVAEAEPAKPVHPGDPPEEPGDPPPQPEKPNFSKDPDAFRIESEDWQDEMDAYEVEVEAWEDKMDAYRDQLDVYEEKVDSYKDDMDTWQDEYQVWKEGRSKAIEQGEAIIDSVRDQWGSAFNVNLKSQWGWMIFIMLVELMLIVGALKLKDRKR